MTRKRRSYSDAFKQDAVKLITKQGYTVADAAYSTKTAGGNMVTGKSDHGSGFRQTVEILTRDAGEGRFSALFNSISAVMESSFAACRSWPALVRLRRRSIPL